MDSRTYTDSEESEDDVVYDGEGESELQRNEVTNKITVDACGEQCAQLDDFNWFLPTDEWYGKSDAPESEIDTAYSGNGVHVITSDSSSPEMDTMLQRLSSPPVVAQTRPKGGCQTAMPRRKRWRQSVRTADSTSAMDTRQESVAPSTLDSERIHKKSECITKGEPILEAAPPASHGKAQPKCSDCSRTADSDILQKELSVMTVTSERWMERFVMNPQVLCLDGLTSDYDHEDRCSDVDSEEGIFQDPIPEVVSV